jgi:hypothetical protein
VSSRGFWQAHRWGCGWAALGVGSLAVIAVLAVSVHLRGYARLRAVLAEQHAAGIGAGPEDYLARCPPIDADLQARAWRRFGWSATWPGTNDDLATRWRAIVAAGATWRETAEDHALIEAARATAEPMRALLRDDRLVLSFAGWLRKDIEDGVSVEHYRFTNMQLSRMLATWFALAGACGDHEAEADLRRLRRALSVEPSIIDNIASTSVQDLLADLRLVEALHGRLDVAAASAADPDEVGNIADAVSSYGVERMFITGRIAEDVLAGRRWPDMGDTDGEYHDRTGLIDWLRGAGDLAAELELMAAQERGETIVLPEPHWVDLRSRFDPRSITPSLDEARRSAERRWKRHRFECLATIIAAAGRDALPADETAAKALVGTAWPSDPSVRYARTPTGFVCGDPSPPKAKRPVKAGSPPALVTISAYAGRVDFAAPSAP